MSNGLIVPLVLALLWGVAACVATWMMRRDLSLARACALKHLTERDEALNRIQVLQAELAARDAMLAEMQRQLLDEINLIGKRIAAGEGQC